MELESTNVFTIKGEVARVLTNLDKREIVIIVTKAEIPYWIFPSGHNLRG